MGRRTCHRFSRKQRASGAALLAGRRPARLRLVDTSRSATPAVRLRETLRRLRALSHGSLFSAASRGRVVSHYSFSFSQALTPCFSGYGGAWQFLDCTIIVLGKAAML